ncbi:uncharacterized protein SPPG_08156 [Spizellomyces punctatus DAOM BR117]|uniref:Uncharacterized protein n=1 Tax=Spizellomyces punctatus (strain DAOM BR117) TaxID=645134 RepID=A0A0L0H6I3_SPIPD|nr:uncharacterized protein SPPG_08156 [Spizellomyces punctatus DAOM BR117]KNC96569.1 hypothetical protein SPPG_08156 [Spizellomyces punctatus DAOM BR117]|eukprot:XP_016604609.1 hypothetical protein SPPG_08156 [Spizellomyces punctatus DAOM BR117]
MTRRKALSNQLVIVLAICASSVCFFFAGPILIPHSQIEKPEDDLISASSACKSQVTLRRAPPRKVVGSYYDDFLRITANIIEVLENRRSGVAVARYGDGERELMLGGTIKPATQAGQVDKWSWEKPGISFLGRDLLDTLSSHYDEPYYYGFAAPVQDASGLRFFINATEQHLDYITFANIWVNDNYKHTKEFIKKIAEQYAGRIVIIANHITKDRSLVPSWASEFFSTPDDCVAFWEQNRDEHLAKIEALGRRHTRKLFMISAGPMAKVYVHKLWNVNPHNAIIDFGSSLDEILKGETTRPYQSASANEVDPSWQLIPQTI